jgi:hypothetical protein
MIRVTGGCDEGHPVTRRCPIAGADEDAGEKIRRRGMTKSKGKPRFALEAKSGSRMPGSFLSPACEGLTMAVQFLLFLMTILLFLIFWELSKIHSRIKKAMLRSMGEPQVMKVKEAMKA